MSSGFEVVADPSRRRLLDLLRDGPVPVGDLVAATGMSQPNTSRHLGVLRRAGLVTSRTAGRQRVYELRIEGFTEAVSTQQLSALGVPLVHDIGSGLLDAACPWLPDGPPAWLAGERASHSCARPL